MFKNFFSKLLAPVQALFDIELTLGGHAAEERIDVTLEDQILRKVDEYAEHCVGMEVHQYGTADYNREFARADLIHGVLTRLVREAIGKDNAPIPLEEMSAVERQEAAFTAITFERLHQDRKWGTIEERPHEVGAWLALVQLHTSRAIAAWGDANNDTAALEQLRKVLAIGVACAEQHGLPPRP